MKSAASLGGGLENDLHVSVKSDHWSFHGSSLGFSVRAHWWFDLTHCSVWALQVSFGRRAFSARFCCSHPPSPFWRWGTLLGPHSIGAWGTQVLQRYFVVLLLGGPRKEVETVSSSTGKPQYSVLGGPKFL